MTKSALAQSSLTVRVLLVVLALLAAPLVVVLAWTLGGSFAAGYWEDVPVGIVFLEVYVAPPALLALAVMRTR